MSISSATPYISLSDALLARHQLAAYYKRMPKAPTDENEAQNLIDWFQGFIVRMDTVIQEVGADKVGVDFNNICENVRAFVEPLQPLHEQALRDAVDLAFANADIEEHHFISLKDLLDEQEKLPATKANIRSSDKESKGPIHPPSATAANAAADVEPKATMNERAPVENDAVPSGGLPDRITPDAKSAIITNVSSPVIAVFMDKKTQPALGIPDFNVSGSKDAKPAPSSDSNLPVVASSKDVAAAVADFKHALVTINERNAPADFESDSTVIDALAVIAADISGDDAKGGR
ncbi:uncharacterized protein LAESUDRAFT_761441 [Laetiporus sulphureus 93-53]|uniref:Uncharacterized protein n=1 Tax=Laetiporus sulphureus 93-53 TaxID=1314785 RepID=A0A165D3I9_9APHY|nr:uncharacterized protein LAESUDRAFT_761441 [Laetiporus sulphureus 93-53]KZT04089.1 hypothetical protein LAESUDRAFT_761441 [Laetiporus sulphureus 93-53]